MAFLNLSVQMPEPSLTSTTGKRAYRAFDRLLWAIILTVFFLGLSISSPAAESGQPREYLVKAAFLYNFAKFVEWPDSVFHDETSPLILCIIGEDPFGKSIDTIKGKTIGGRELLIKQVRSVDSISGCHIVFISRSERGNLHSILRYAERLNLLTVSDINNFTGRGGIIGFTIRDNKVRFEINVEAAERAELKISSNLLKLATIVRDNR